MSRKKKEIESVRSDQVPVDTQKSHVTPPGGGDYRNIDTHVGRVPPAEQLRGDLEVVDALVESVSSFVGEGDHFAGDTQFGNVSLSHLIHTITELWHRRQSWHRAEKSLTLQIRALCRRLCPLPQSNDSGTLRQRKKNPDADALYCAMETVLNPKSRAPASHRMLTIGLGSTMALFHGRDPIEAARLEVEKQLRQLGAQLPGARYCMDTVGLSTLLLAALIGECPGIHSRGFLDFDTPSRVWKRCGLAVMPDGTRQRKVTGAEALDHGYSPTRRAMVWTFGNSLIKSGGPYYILYLTYKEQERTKAEGKGFTVLPSAQITDKRKQSGQYISEGHIHNRAKRRMEKAMVCDVWAAFRTDAGQPTTSRFLYRAGAEVCVDVGKPTEQTEIAPDL